jgi:hypothetical protein
VLDNNGFIILSEKYEQTGLFFGQADGTIMDSLVQDGIYKRVPMYDNQGVCEDSKANDSDSARLLKVRFILLVLLFFKRFDRRNCNS